MTGGSEFPEMPSSIKYEYFPQGRENPEFVDPIVGAFRRHEDEISTIGVPRSEGPNSDDVLAIVRADLEELGFDVETDGDPIDYLDTKLRPDGYHPKHRLILEVELGQAWDNNAVPRDILKAVTIENVAYLTLAVPVEYGETRGYKRSVQLARDLFESNRVDLPFELLLIGY